MTIQTAGGCSWRAIYVRVGLLHTHLGIDPRGTGSGHPELFWGACWQTRTGFRFGGRYPIPSTRWPRYPHNFTRNGDQLSLYSWEQSFWHAFDGRYDGFPALMRQGADEYRGGSR